jgi:hypothetical protein
VGKNGKAGKKGSTAHVTTKRFLSGSKTSKATESHNVLPTEQTFLVRLKDSPLSTKCGAGEETSVGVRLWLRLLLFGARKY